MEALQKPDSELKAIILSFTAESIEGCRIIETSRGENDFRLVVIAAFSNGSRLVIKLADNSFTCTERIEMWQRTILEYKKLGYYAPEIFPDRCGGFPVVEYKGRRCTCYAEEYTYYTPAEDRSNDNSRQGDDDWGYMRDAWIMTGKVASKHFSYTKLPSAYCMFERFCSDDECDEVLEAAQKWKRAAEALPAELHERAERIWQLWQSNRNELEKLYSKLPRSVFQADLNDSNILLDENGRFVGVCDFNISGSEVVIKYILSENNQASLERIFKVLESVSGYYSFSELEMQAALLVYRAVTPFWWCRSKQLEEAVNDISAAELILADAERVLTENIDFRSHMAKQTEE